MLHRFGDRASQDEHRPHARPRQTVQLVDRGQIGRRYHGVKDPRDSLWTEITKDLVLREAIERAGYEYEETEHFYYVFSFLNYVCIFLPPPCPGADARDRTTWTP